MENLRIPSEERHRFAQPLGKLIAGKRNETILEVEKIIKDYLKSNFSLNIYIVGDIVTKDFLANNFLKSFIKICIIDEKTKRNQIKLQLGDFFEDVFELENPEGSINKESFALLSKIIKSNRRTLLRIINGEEDLLVLPLVLELQIEKPSKNLVFYGQPPITDAKNPIPEGIVIIEVQKAVKKAVKKLIKIMEPF